MGHYAKIDNNKVTNVIVAKEGFISTLAGEWLKTSYNTRGGIHTEGGEPIRKNFASIGYTYDRENDAFITPTPHSVILLDLGDQRSLL